MGRKGGIDWPRGRSLYVNSGLTQADVARHLGVSVRAVQRHCVAEGWVAQRQAQSAKTVALADEKAAEQAAGELAQASAETRATVDVLSTRLHVVVSAALDLVAAVITTKLPNPELVSLEDAIALLSLAANVIKTTRDAATPAQQQAAQSHTTNLIVALQSLGAEGRVAVYQQLADR